MTTFQNPSKDDEITAQFLRLWLCGRWAPTASDTARVLNTRSDPDWAALHKLAQNEDLIPLFYQSIRDQDFLPSLVEQDLRLAYFRQARDNLALFQELENALHRLHEASISALLLKGAALIKTIYDDNIAVRPMHDVDLLVRQEDASSTLEILSALAFEPSRPEPRAGDTLIFEYEMKLCKSGRIDTPISVHWSLFDSPHHQRILPMDWFWQTALPTHVGEATAKTLGPEAQLLHLCGHLVLHHGGQERQMLRLHDVAAVIAFYEEQIDWDLVLAQTQACDLVLPLQQVLAQVAGEWYAPIPPAVLERLHSLHPSPDEQRIVTQLAATRHWQARRLWVDMTSLPSWGQRLRYAWHHLFPSPGYMQHRYHISHRLLTPLYYPYRWFRGLRSALGRQDR